MYPFNTFQGKKKDNHLSNEQNFASTSGKGEFLWVTF